MGDGLADHGEMGRFPTVSEEHQTATSIVITSRCASIPGERPIPPNRITDVLDRSLFRLPLAVAARQAWAADVKAVFALMNLDQKLRHHADFGIELAGRLYPLLGSWGR